MTVMFEGGKNIAMKVSPHQYEATGGRQEQFVDLTINGGNNHGRQGKNPGAGSAEA